MKKYSILLLILAAVLPLSSCKQNQLPEWKEGMMDIHFISTARGECAYYVLPDGTTMMIDAGECVGAGRGKYPASRQRPDSLTRPSDAFAAYIKHFMPAVSKDSLDYVVLTHLHIDHMGNTERGFAKDPEGGYILTGISAVNDKVPFRTVIDRCWPDYPTADPHFKKKSTRNWIQYMHFGDSTGRFKAEKFELGSTSQIALKHHPEKYPDFKVLNIAVNGYYWDGQKAVDGYNRAVEEPRENACSCCNYITYGDFDWYTGGDSHQPQMEIPIAKTIGHKIEAMKANHHMAWNTMDTLMLSILQPRVIVSVSYDTHKPWIPVLRENIYSDAGYSGPKSVYFLGLHPDLLQQMPELDEKAASKDGHVVIRVLPGGKKYYVYVLDDCDPDYKVVKRDGPFICE